MTRRSGRGTRRATGGRPLAAEFAALFQSGDYRFEASAYHADGGVPTNTADFYNQITPAALLAATGAQQALLPVANASFNNQLTATFASPFRYDSSEAVSAWNFCHNGSGFDIFTGFRPTSAVAFGILHATMRFQDPATRNGFVLGYRTSGTPGLYLRVGRSGVPSTIDADIACGVASGTATYANASYSSTASPNWVLRLKGTTVSSGAQGAAPGAGDAHVTLRLGANGQTSDFPFVGEWPFTYIFKRVLTAYQRSIVQRYIQATYGLAP